MIPDVHRYDGCLMVLVRDQGQPIGKHKSLVGDLDRSLLRRRRLSG
jgi:hypothetical protein